MRCTNIIAVKNNTHPKVILYIHMKLMKVISATLSSLDFWSFTDYRFNQHTSPMLKAK